MQNQYNRPCEEVYASWRQCLHTTYKKTNHTKELGRRFKLLSKYELACLFAQIGDTSRLDAIRTEQLQHQAFAVVAGIRAGRSTIDFNRIFGGEENIPPFARALAKELGKE